jgi:hypothetical protein
MNAHAFAVARDDEAGDSEILIEPSGIFSTPKRHFESTGIACFPVRTFASSEAARSAIDSLGTAGERAAVVQVRLPVQSG